MDPQTARWWQIDPVTDGYEQISPYASMYDNPLTFMDPLGDEGEECCLEALKATNNFIKGAVLGTAAGLLDNLTGSNVRGELSSSFEGTGAAGQGFNAGLAIADAGGVVIGASSMVTGGTGAAGGTLVTIGTGGLSSPVSLPIATAGTALIVFGANTLKNSVHNLVNQNGRVNANSKQTGSYTNTHQSAKTYSGKGTNQRAAESANRVSKQYNDPVKKTEWKASKNTREAFKAEDKRIQKNGGAGNVKKNYNKINSPGKKYNEQDKP